jgi:uncharacterized membrane protein
MNNPKITPTPQSLFGDLDLDLPRPETLEKSEAEAAVAQQPNKTKAEKTQPNKTQPAKTQSSKTQPHKTQPHKTQPAPSAAALAGQAFLPGLSRRGRPRLQTPISAVERTAEHRRKRIEAGAKRLEMILDRDVSSALDALAEHFKEPRSEVISTLILKAASRVLKG